MTPSYALRSRIAAAIGLAALVPLVNTPADTGTTGDTGAAELIACIPPNGGTTAGATPSCPSEGEAENQLLGTDAGSCEVGGVTGDATYDAETGECCYPIVCLSDVEDKPCGCYGRPFVVDGVVRTAGSESRSDWLARQAAPAPVPAALRPALVRFWLENAEAEHSSVAGFAKLALDLVAVGAPASLVARAQTGGIEELEHTLACYALASAYAGEALGPRALKAPPFALAEDLLELAVATAREGCVGETIAAHLAGEIARRASDPAVRAVMVKIAEEEARHAELAWETLAWALAAGGEPVRDAVAAVFVEPFHPPEDDGVADDPVLRAHGLLPSAERAEIGRYAHAEVVMALAGAMLARRAA